MLAIAVVIFCIAYPLGLATSGHLCGTLAVDFLLTAGWEGGHLVVFLKHAFDHDHELREHHFCFLRFSVTSTWGGRFVGILKNLMCIM